jgi:signal peptidase I
METASNLGCDLATEVVGTFGAVYLRVSGTSMAPSIRPGDLVSVQPASVTEVSPGEIVVFAREGRLIVHRVTFSTSSNGEPHLVTRGDRARRNDAPVSGSELIGRVTRIERGPSRISVPSRLNFEKQAICRLLRFSDRTTYFYLYVASRWRELFPRRAVCRP